MLHEELTLDSLIVPNTSLYIVEGAFTKYFVEDYLTGELIEYIPIPGQKRYSAFKVPAGSTYRDRSGTEEDKVSFMTEGLHPFETPDFVSTSEGLYRVVLDPMVSYVSEDMDKLLETVSFKLANLATGDISYAKYKDIHERGEHRVSGRFNDDFCKDLYTLSRTSSGYDRAFLNGLLYSCEFQDNLRYGKYLIKGKWE